MRFDFDLQPSGLIGPLVRKASLAMATEEDPVIDEEEPEDEGEWPEEGELATAWERSRSIRERLLSPEHPFLSRWPNMNSVGVPSVKAMNMNSEVLQIMAEIWCPKRSFPKTMPIQLLRLEAPQVL